MKSKYAGFLLAALLSLSGIAQAAFSGGSGGMAVGSTVTGATAGRVAFFGAGPVLADSTDLTYNDTTKRLRVGTTGTSSGVVIGYEGDSGYGGIWFGDSYTAAPTNANVSISSNGVLTSILANTSSGRIDLYVDGALKVRHSATAGAGPVITAGTAATDVAALSVTRTNNNAAVVKGVEITYTDTTSAAGFLPLAIRGGAGGVTDLLTLSKAGLLTTPSLATPGTLGVRALSTLTDGADGTNTNAYKFVSFVSNSAEAGNVIRVAQTSAVVFTTSSSRELKNLRGDSNLDAATDRIMAYKMREYDWKSQPGTLYNGPIAEEVYAVNPDPMLFPGGDKAINMSGFIPDLIMAVQRLNAKVDGMKRQ